MMAMAMAMTTTTTTRLMNTTNASCRNDVPSGKTAPRSAAAYPRKYAQPRDVCVAGMKTTPMQNVAAASIVAICTLSQPAAVSAQRQRVESLRLLVCSRRLREERSLSLLLLFWQQAFELFSGSPFGVSSYKQEQSLILEQAKIEAEKKEIENRLAQFEDKVDLQRVEEDAAIESGNERRVSW